MIDGPLQVQADKSNINFTVPLAGSFFVNSTQPVSFSFGVPGTGFTYHGPGQRGTFAVNFFRSFSSDCDSILALDKASSFSASTRIKTLTMHGILMAFSFSLVYPAGIFVARYHTRLSKWLDIHQALMSIVASNTIIVAITALVTNALSQGVVIHTVLGIFIMSTIFIVMLGGLF